MSTQVEKDIKKLKDELAALQGAHVEPQVKVVFPPRERKLPKFSGVPSKEGDFYSLNDFLVDVQAVCDARHETSDADRAGVIISSLEGLARDEVKCLSGEEQKNPTVVIQTLKAAVQQTAANTTQSGNVSASLQ